MSAFLEGLRLVAAPDVLLALVLASIYGLVVGSLPGLSATMATALLVPVTFYLSPMAAVATIIAASAMAIFSGDIPGCLLRIPGTPASAAYTDEAYAMTRKGQPELALGICLWFSALGGIAGTLSLILLAPALAEMALSFSTFEYFWLAFLGLMCATLVARSSPVKAIASALLGLLVACIGIENPAGTPRFTFGNTDLLGGIEVIPALVGVFAVSEVMRAMTTPEPPPLPPRRFGSILKGQWALTKAYPKQQARGNLVGIIIGVLPVAAFGIIGYVMEANGYPVAALVLGVVMGAMVEQSFVTSLIKSDGSLLPFVQRPIAAVLAAMTAAALLWPVALWAYRRLAPPAAPARLSASR